MTSIVVGKNRISLLESERYVAGTNRVYKIKIAFSEDWDGVDKKVVFKTDSFELLVDIVDTAECFPIPKEVLAEPTAKLQIGAFGYRCNDVVLSTRWTTLGRVMKGTINTDCCCHPTPSKPSPATYDKLVDLIQGKANRMTFEDGMFCLWADDTLLSSFEPPITLPEGGTTDQVLAKASNADGDYYWRTITSTTETAASYKVPLGTIQIWSGSLDNIPASYSLCDGQNGTPDLRFAMIVGASESIEPGTVVNGPTESTPMPITRTEKAHPDTMRYYALAFVQKTSLTEADKKEGQTAYDIAIENGFTGTQQEWLNSLAGKDGKSAYEFAVEHGYNGNETEFARTLVLNASNVIDGARITAVDQIPAPGFGAFVFNDAQFLSALSRGNAVQFRSNIAYIDTSDKSRIVITTLDNRVYICHLNSAGQITSVEESEAKIGADGKSAYQIAVDNGFEGTEQEWLNSLVGSTGADGKSAYQIAVDNGFAGSEKEWLASLKGEKGDKGDKGDTVTGDGEVIQGPAGKSAYQIAVDNGFEGTEQEWLESLVGPAGTNGQSAYELAKSNGFSGTEEEWLASLKGSTGLSAYQVAKANGFDGTEAEWVESLKGASGENGQSAYQIAVDNGFEGTEQEWLESLKGQNGSDGKSAYQIAIDNGFEGTEQEWLESLKGTGSGVTGSDGKSAYQIAVDNGFEGTEQEWLESLKGEKGDDGYGLPGLSAYQIAVNNGFIGDEATWIASLKGATGQQGASAYQIAVDNGFEGDKSAWLQSLKGDTGAIGPVGEDGNSAYQIAVDNGFEGTEQQWLASLKGATGESAYQIAVDNGFEGTEQEWLDSLKGKKGDDGKSAYQIAVDNGFEGTEQEWTASIEHGKSAYELAVENGYQGTLQQWLDSLKGEGIAEFLTYADQTITSRETLISVQDQMSIHFERCTLAAANGTSVRFDDELVYVVPDMEDAEQVLFYRQNGDAITASFGEDEIFSALTIQNGSAGKSAYQIAVDNGFEGTESEWLASLKGANGKTVRTLDDYSGSDSGEDPMVGRWIDDKPIRRRVIVIDSADLYAGVPTLLGNIPASVILTRFDCTVLSEEHWINAEDSPRFETTVPFMHCGIHVGKRYDVDTGDLTMIVDGVPEGIDPGTPIATSLVAYLIVEYVDPSAPDVTDEDMVVGESSSEVGTTDHRMLAHRDAAQQHPIAAISGLADRLAATPTKTITDEQINSLFA